MSEYISPVEQLVHSTIRIECESGDGISSGSGYYFGFLAKKDWSVPCIVTNKHVVKGAKRGKFHLSIKKDDGTPDLGKHVPAIFDNFEDMWIGHPDSNIDLAIFPLAPIFEQAKQKGINVPCLSAWHTQISLY